MNLYSHRSQAATEYLMTYGWAFLIIAIVAAILISLGVFSPSPSSTVTGFTSFTSASASVSKINGLVLTLTNTNPNTIYLTNVSLSSSSGLKIGKVIVLAKLGTYSSSNPLFLLYYNNSEITNLSIPSGQSFTIIISNVSAYSSYSTQATITYFENGIPQSSTGTISGTPVSSSLASKYFPIVIFTELGLPSGTSWSVTYNGVTKSSTSSSIIFNATSNSQSFSVLRVNTPTCIYAPSPSSGSITAGSIQTISFGCIATVVFVINITNTQTVATSNPFQQMINVSSSSPIWPYINTNQTSAFGQNVEFIYPNGTVIPSWLESYSSNNAIWWIKIGSIPANSKLTIYAQIAPKSTNLFNNKTTGEAPQLSPTYAEYDDGANVFNFYDNFKGTSLNTSKWSVTNNGGFTLTVNNGLTMTQTGAGDNREGIITVNSIPIPSIIEMYGKIPQDVSTSYDMSMFGFMSALAPNSDYWATIGTFNSVGNIYLSSLYATNNSQTNVLTNYNSYARSNNIWGVAYNGAVITSELNYGDSYSLSYSTTATLYLGFYLEGNGNSSYFAQWVRVRAYPPNGVMPSVSIG
ncbi:MAG: DUF2341 domain-containing protein [Candidatus Rehaiarchaeum fermentans]|nr:DUF2341 domain-containing protein [Candidatus Rehaiarchaeum fermentans]